MFHLPDKPIFSHETPQVFFSEKLGEVHDIHPDGKHFVAVQQVNDISHVVIVINWFEELKRKVPTTD